MACMMSIDCIVLFIIIIVHQGDTFSLVSFLYNIWELSTGGMRSIDLVRSMYSCIIIGKSQFLKNIQIGVKINKITFFCENSGVVPLFNFLLAPLWSVFL